MENTRLAECVAASASRTVEQRYNDQAMSKDEVKGTNFARCHPYSREDTNDQDDYNYDYYGPPITDNSNYHPDVCNNDGSDYSMQDEGKLSKISK